MWSSHITQKRPSEYAGVKKDAKLIFLKVLLHCFSVSLYRTQRMRNMPLDQFFLASSFLSSVDLVSSIFQLRFFRSTNSFEAVFLFGAILLGSFMGNLLSFRARSLPSSFSYERVIEDSLFCICHSICFQCNNRCLVIESIHFFQGWLCITRF